MSQEQVSKRESGSSKEDQDDKRDHAAAVAGQTATAEALASETDDLLQEIDDVLETEAEAFVKNYVQKGGQ